MRLVNKMKGFSHNPERPSYGTTENEYKSFFKRIEKSFSPDEMTKDNLAEWMNNDTLAETFAVTKVLSDLINSATTVEELKNLIPDAESLQVHSGTLINRIEGKIEQLEIEQKEQEIADSIARTEEFAEQKGITLTDKIIGRQEKWGESKVISIRDNKGRFVSWKRI